MKTYSKTCTTLFVILIASFLSISHATDLRWISVGNGDWNDNTKWRFSNNIPCGCIPTASDNVEILNGTVRVPDGHTGFARTVKVYANAELRIGSPLVNTTILNIGPANENGIEVDQNGIVIIYNNDRLNISGITNSGTNISAVRNSGEFEIESNGRLTIEDSGADGIYNAGKGSKLTNNGRITIDNLVLAGSDGIFNGLDGFITNESSGSITINLVRDSQGEGIDNRYTFANFGTIDITDVRNASGLSSALHPSAIFANHGILNISNIKGRGIWVHTDGEFLNKPNGKLTIMDIDGDDGIEVLQTFENEGTISINNVNGASADGIDTRQTFVNTGTIDIDNINDSHGIFNTAFFTNDVTGFINIDFFDDEGVRNQAGATFANDGDIAINQNNSGTSSHGILNLGTFSNSDNIIVSRIFGLDSEGIYNDGDFTSTGGKITLDVITDSGILNDVDATFNMSATLLTITDTDTGIENKGTLDYGGDGTILNAAVNGILNDGSNSKMNLVVGELTINGSGTAGLVNDAQFNNNECFELKISDKIVLGPNSDVTNKGFIFQNFNSFNTAFSGSTFLNNGVVEDRNQSFSILIKDWSHNGLYAGPLKGYYSLGARSQGVLLGKQQGISKSSQYFIQAALINGAGSLGTAIHEWLPSEVINTVYFQVNNGCMTRVIRQDLDNQVLYGCEDVPAASKVANYAPIDASKGWFFSYNWDTQQVPTYCLDVDIDNPNSMTVDPTYLGMGRTLDVELGVDFDVPGELHIQNFDQSPPSSNR